MSNMHTTQQLRILNKFRKRLDKEKYINNYASDYYGNMNNRFTIPGIIITGISSIASFLATSDIMNADTKTGITIGVGILAAGSTIIQSVATSFGFQARRDSFQMVSDAYDDLITKIEFEIINPNEEFNDFCNMLESAILKIKTDCKYLPPLFIQKKYEKEAHDLALITAIDGLDYDKESCLDNIIPDTVDTLFLPHPKRICTVSDTPPKRSPTKQDEFIINLDMHNNNNLLNTDA